MKFALNLLNAIATKPAAETVKKVSAIMGTAAYVSSPFLVAKMIYPKHKKSALSDLPTPPCKV